MYKEKTGLGGEGNEWLALFNNADPGENGAMWVRGYKLSVISSENLMYGMGTIVSNTMFCSGKLLNLKILTTHTQEG